MKNNTTNEVHLQFPLPAWLYEKAKKELEQDDKNSMATSMAAENCTRTMICRRINGLLYKDIWLMNAG